ncbi:MAG TPA: heme-copper oxidase subunit III [Silvibacterium sp.]|jgi:cytochrome c oxidase subunit 3/cytochrome o ubiquinol oxidase subunit 3|nr:heme-copper oxidase subunit III [Silvibacterium sp.]
MSAIPIVPGVNEQAWNLPSRGRVGMYCLIIGESAIFTIFVVAYVFYIGKSLYGPTPEQVLDVPIFNTICLLSSSVTIWLAERAIERNSIRTFGLWWAATIVLGLVFLTGTGIEWHRLIYHDGLTISTNLFGTTFYSLVGLHATHVVVGLSMLLLVLIFVFTGHVRQEHSERIQVLALYWHFVDAVWVIVFTVVYIVGR